MFLVTSLSRYKLLEFSFFLDDPKVIPKFIEKWEDGYDQN